MNTPATNLCTPVFRGPHRCLRQLLPCLLVLFGLLCTAAESRATVYQTIGVNVMSPETFRIGRKVYPIDEMTTVVAGEIRGPDRVQVKIFLPLGIKKEVVEDIKDRCRQAGAKAFFIVYKS
jgi:hypothetical protein